MGIFKAVKAMNASEAQADVENDDGRDSSSRQAAGRKPGQTTTPAAHPNRVRRGPAVNQVA
jgi:hypothetical protein